MYFQTAIYSNYTADLVHRCAKQISNIPSGAVLPNVTHSDVRHRYEWFIYADCC